MKAVILQMSSFCLVWLVPVPEEGLGSVSGLGISSFSLFGLVSVSLECLGDLGSLSCLGVSSFSLYGLVWVPKEGMGGLVPDL